MKPCRLLFTFLSLFSLLMLQSCGYKSQKPPAVVKPSNLYSKEEMVKLITDVQLLEAAVNLKNAENQNLNKKDTLVYSDLFRKYRTSYSEFQENFNYYASQPEVLGSIYDEVISELTRREAELNKKK